MANDLGTSKTGSNSKVNYCAPTNPNKDSCVPVVVQQAVINLFFDGTKNNYYNIRDYNEKKGFKEKMSNVTSKKSYTITYSNVAQLFSNRIKKTDGTWVYIEGMGTVVGKIENKVKFSSGERDVFTGYVYGSGETGITERAKMAFDEIIREFENDYGSNSRPASLKINIFGFSRGAATARHFIHLAKTQPNLFKKWGLKANQIRFGFVGLFDTVSSYSEQIPLPNFKGDVNELKLDFRNLDENDKKITKVFHIVAGDEYREYFALTDISSTIDGKSKYGIEVTLDGAHSDIGGGYNKITNEDYYFEGTTLREWFIKKGFYTEGQISTKPWGDANIFPKQNNSLVNFEKIYTESTRFYARRKQVVNDLHKVSLRMMRFVCQEYAKLSFYKTIQNYEENAEKMVLELIRTQPQEAFNKLKWGTRLDLRIKDENKIKSLRNQFIHWSVENKTGFQVNIKDGLPYRIPYHG